MFQSNLQRKLTVCLGKTARLSRKSMKGRCYSSFLFFLIHAIVVAHILIHLFIAVFAAGLKLLDLLIIFALENKHPLHHTREDWHGAGFLQWHSGWSTGTSALSIFGLQVSMASLRLALLAVASNVCLVNPKLDSEFCHSSWLCLASLLKPADSLLSCYPLGPKN